MAAVDLTLLLPFVGPVLAFIGSFAAAGLAWLANRSRARLPAEAQRPLRVRDPSTRAGRRRGGAGGAA